MTTHIHASHRARRLAPLACSIALLMGAIAAPADAQQSFKSADEAVTALVQAAKAGDRNDLLTVLGRDGEDIIASGDEVADKETRERFLTAYDDKHAIAMEGDNKAIVIVGKDDFPFPIPIVRKGDAWQFDTAAGREEILFRRIGRNEIDAIHSCLAYVDAQDDYADADHGAGVGVYAQRIISQQGQKDGLYWPTSAGEAPSPLGDLIASATEEGYRVGAERTPYHGYYFKVLTRQGAAAPGGAIDYVVNGKMIGGFALVAWPADYGNSGVMTFIVNHEGIVYQKDFGERTAQLAPAISAFDPDKSWMKVETDDLP